jgi:hypothetical protein
LEWLAIVDPSMALTTVRVLPETPVTSIYSLSILILNWAIDGKLDASTTITVVVVGWSSITPFRVVMASLENCSIVMGY